MVTLGGHGIAQTQSKHGGAVQEIHSEMLGVAGISFPSYMVMGAGDRLVFGLL